MPKTALPIVRKVSDVHVHGTVMTKIVLVFFEFYFWPK